MSFFTMVGAAGILACASKDSEPGGDTTPKYCDPSAIMLNSCSGLVCHGEPGSPAGYNTDLFNAPAGKTMAQAMMNEPANYELVANPTTCPTSNPELLLNQNSPGDSLILKKIFGTQACGVMMPNASSGSSVTLTQEQKDCFVSWVYGVTGHEPPTGSGGAPGTGSGGSGTSGASGGSVGSGGTSSGGGPGSGGAAASGGGPAGSGGRGSTIPPTFETLKTVITDNNPSCIGSDCHGGFPQRLDLRVDDGLLDRLETWTSDVCGMPIVTPGDPSQSALVKVLTTGCGNVFDKCNPGVECIPRMPYGCTPGFDCIPDDYIAAIEQWITDGAPMD